MFLTQRNAACPSALVGCVAQHNIQPVFTSHLLPFLPTQISRNAMWHAQKLVPSLSSSRSFYLQIELQRCGVRCLSTTKNSAGSRGIGLQVLSYYRIGDTESCDVEWETNMAFSSIFKHEYYLKRQRTGGILTTKQMSSFICHHSLYLKMCFIIIIQV